MNLSKKLLLIVGFVGLCAGRPVVALSEDTKNALTIAVLNTASYWCFADDYRSKKQEKLLLQLLYSEKIILESLIVYIIVSKWYEKKLSLLPDVGDEKLLAECKKLFTEFGATNADKLQIKKNTPNTLDSYICLGIPIIVLSEAALQLSRRPTAFHELGHLVDKNCIIEYFCHGFIEPQVLLWVVYPISQKVSKYVCGPFLDKIVDGTGAVTERVTGSKEITRRVKELLSTAKKFVEVGVEFGFVFASCLGIEAFFAAWRRKNEKFADNFAFNNLKNAPKILSRESDLYNIRANIEKNEQRQHPVSSWFNSWFATHPSSESRSKVFSAQKDAHKYGL